MTAIALAPSAILRAARYLRISEDKAEDEAGVTRQDEDTAKLVADMGWDEAGPAYEDNDLSATKGKPRPAYERLMAAAARGEFDVIVVFQQSRLWRNRRERAEGIEVLSRAGVDVIPTKGARLDLSSAQGRVMAAMLGEFDTLEVEVKGERTQRAQRDATKAGLHLGGPRPFGWRVVPDPARQGKGTLAYQLAKVKPELHETEAGEVRRLAHELLAGRSLGALVRDLNERGILTTWGKPWTAASLRVTLTRKRNYGIAEFNGEEFPGAWPTIFDEATHRKLVTLLADPARRLSPDNKVKYLLSGIARCGVLGCGLPVKSGSTTNRDGTRRRLYKCPKEHLFRSQEAADAVVTGVMLELLENMTPAQRLAMLAEDDPGSSVATDAARLRGKLAELLDMWQSDEITRPEFKQRSASLRAELQSVERKMARVSKVPILHEFLAAGDMREVWARLPLDRQRSIIRELLEVMILPGDPGRTLVRGAPLTEESVGLEITWDAAYKRWADEATVDPAALWREGEPG